MRKFRFIFAVVLCGFCFQGFAAIPESQALVKAERMVDALFKDLSVVSNRSTNSATISKIKADFDNKHFRSDEQNCPNDFKIVWAQNTNIASKDDIRPMFYFNSFYSFFEDNGSCSFNYERLGSCIVTEPEFKKNEAPARLAQVIVRKVYKRNNMPFAAFNDTLVVGLQEMKIRAWANNTSRHSIGYFGGEVLDIEQLKVSAALAYNSKQYYKAYQIYQSIVQKYPEEGDPYYRMAIMLYKKDYGYNLSKRERQRLILEYLDKAIRHGGASTRSCADNMRYWITC